MKNRLGKTIKRKREALGLSQEQLAGRVGYSDAALGKLERGETASPNGWERIADVLGIERDDMRKLIEEAAREAGKTTKIPRHVTTAVRDLTTGAGSRRNRVPTIPVRAAGGSDVALLPVLGRAAAAEPDRIIMLDAPAELIPCPPELVGVNGAYAVWIGGDSMEPRYLSGEIAYVHPFKSVGRHDHCIVQIGAESDEDESAPPESGFVKKFEGWAEGELVVSQYNPPQELHFPRNQVRAVHLIVGTKTG